MGTRKRVEVEVPDGQHLGWSRDTDGARRAHLFDDDTNALVGHAELFEVDDTDDAPTSSYAHSSDASDDDLNELAELLGNLLALAIIAAATAAAPHIKRFWTDKVLVKVKAVPGKLKAAPRQARTKWGRIVQSRRTSRSEIVVDPAPAHGSISGVDVVLDELRATMTSDEARARFAAALAAQAFADEQLRMLQHSRIEDGPDSGELENALRALTPDQVAQTIALLLDQDRSLLSRDKLAAIGDTFAGNQIAPRQLAMPASSIGVVLRSASSPASPGPASVEGLER